MPVKEIKGPKGMFHPLEPSYEIPLENPLHKSPRSSTAGYLAAHLQQRNYDLPKAA
jgi:hypothetical protein